MQVLIQSWGRTALHADAESLSECRSAPCACLQHVVKG